MGIIEALGLVFALAIVRVLWACYLVISTYVPVVDRWCKHRIRENRTTFLRTGEYRPRGVQWIHDAYDAIDVDAVILQALARPWAWRADALVPPEHREQWLKMKGETP